MSNIETNTDTFTHKCIMNTHIWLIQTGVQMITAVSLIFKYFLLDSFIFSTSSYLDAAHNLHTMLFNESRYDVNVLPKYQSAVNVDVMYTLQYVNSLVGVYLFCFCLSSKLPITMSGKHDQ